VLARRGCGAREVVADYNLLEPPRQLLQIVSGEYFLAFCLFVAPIVFAVTVIDHRIVARRCPLCRHSIQLTDRVQPSVPMALRLATCIFFLTATCTGAISDQAFILTPELETRHTLVAVIQLTIALFALRSHTACLSGLGIVVLYVIAVTEFGIYHMLDYPIFVGVAAYLVMSSSFSAAIAVVRQNVLRVCTSATLLWASIEKFAYPEWSFKLLESRPEITFGLDVEFYMVAAGFVEFCAAYLLLTGELSARAAAVLLLFFFISAIYYFGLIDAIGHFVIIVVLLVPVASRNTVKWPLEFGSPIVAGLAHTALFFGLLNLLVGIYGAAHCLSYNSVAG